MTSIVILLVLLCGVGPSLGNYHDFEDKLPRSMGGHERQRQLDLPKQRSDVGYERVDEQSGRMANPVSLFLNKQTALPNQQITLNSGIKALNDAVKDLDYATSYIRNRRQRHMYNRGRGRQWRKGYLWETSNSVRRKTARDNIKKILSNSKKSSHKRSQVPTNMLSSSQLQNLLNKQSNPFQFSSKIPSSNPLQNLLKKQSYPLQSSSNPFQFSFNMV